MTPEKIAMTLRMEMMDLRNDFQRQINALFAESKGHFENSSRLHRQIKELENAVMDLKAKLRGEEA